LNITSFLAFFSCHPKARCERLFQGQYVGCGTEDGEAHWVLGRTSTWLRWKSVGGRPPEWNRGNIRAGLSNIKKAGHNERERTRQLCVKKEHHQLRQGPTHRRMSLMWTVFSSNYCFLRLLPHCWASLNKELFADARIFFGPAGCAPTATERAIIVQLWKIRSAMKNVYLSSYKFKRWSFQSLGFNVGCQAEIKAWLTGIWFTGLPVSHYHFLWLKAVFVTFCHSKQFLSLFVTFPQFCHFSSLFWSSFFVTHIRWGIGFSRTDDPQIYDRLFAAPALAHLEVTTSNSNLLAVNCHPSWSV